MIPNEVNAILAEAIKRSGLLPGLEAAELTRLLSHTDTLDLHSGQVLFHTGDPADAAYVVLEGSLQVFIAAPGGVETVLARLEPGDFLGEQGLLGARPRPRNASARALTAARLARVPRAAFAEALMRADRATLESKALLDATERSAATSALGRQLPMASLASLAVAHRSYAAGETVFRQGDRGDEVFIVERGCAAIYREEAGQLVRLSRVEAGGFFGERGVLRREPRAASVMAEGDLDVLVLDGAAFLAEIERSPTARSFLAAFDALYRLPRRGLIVLGHGTVDGEAAATALYHLLDDRQVMVARTLTSDLVAFREAGSAHACDWCESAQAPGVRLGYSGDRLVAIEAGGEWAGLGDAAALLLENRPFDAWRRSIFNERGRVRLDDAAESGLASEVICACTGVTLGELEPWVATGCGVEGLCAATGAGTVCGSCRPRLETLCGDASMMPLQITSATALTSDIHRFRLLGVNDTLPAAPPGAHTVLEGFIDGHWVRRSYTLTGLRGGADGWEIAVKRETKGLFSTWLFSAGKGALLRASRPSGGSSLVDTDRPVVCFVAGIGVTPAIAFARGGVGQPLIVHHTVRTRDEAAFLGELAQFAADGRISHRLCVTSERERPGAADVSALVDTYPAASFVICGPSAFEEAIAGYLVVAGVARNRIHIERFSPAGAPPPVDPEAKRPSLPAVCPVAHDGPTATLDKPMTAEQEAHELIMQFHRENDLSASLPAKLAQLRAATPYHPDPEELAFAARVAWRNSSRCIGRLYWKGLVVRDRREVRTAEGMLDEMVEHLRLATNGGRLRSVLTVFPPLDEHPPRIVSSQLVRYAGYRRADGRVVGDPAQLALTTLAEGAGWRGAGSAFDVLPLLVSDTDGHLWRRDLDPADVLEVSISHPTLAWFADLKLKWHALPAISDQCLDAFGRLYPVVFNGWYMGTEIGARNLSDPYRYDLLPEIAKRMHLDRRSDASLWRDRALVELNVAVLHSFQKAGVTVLDHHTASREFLDFIGFEHGCGRPVQADWSWVVPPISGSATPQYHLDFPNLRYKPAFVPREG